MRTSHGHSRRDMQSTHKTSIMAEDLAKAIVRASSLMEQKEKTLTISVLYRSIDPAVTVRVRGPKIIIFVLVVNQLITRRTTLVVALLLLTTRY